MKYSGLKIPRCLQEATVVFDTQNKHDHIFLSGNDRPFLRAFIELQFPLPDSMEVIELMDVEVQEFFRNLTGGFTVCGKS